MGVVQTGDLTLSKFIVRLYMRFIPGNCVVQAVFSFFLGILRSYRKLPDTLVKILLNTILYTHIFQVLSLFFKTLKEPYRKT